MLGNYLFKNLQFYHAIVEGNLLVKCFPIPYFRNKKYFLKEKNNYTHQNWNWNILKIYAKPYASYRIRSGKRNLQMIKLSAHCDKWYWACYKRQQLAHAAHAISGRFQQRNNWRNVVSTAKKSNSWNEQLMKKTEYWKCGLLKPRFVGHRDCQVSWCYMSLIQWCVVQLMQDNMRIWNWE